jgi:hypothetical protein
MYPTAELTDLAARKAVLRAKILVDRQRCCVQATEAARPLHLIDRVVTQWRKIPPIAKIAVLPLGLLLRRAVAARGKEKIMGRAMRFVPMVMNALKILKTARR